MNGGTTRTEKLYPCLSRAVWNHRKRAANKRTRKAAKQAARKDDR